MVHTNTAVPNCRKIQRPRNSKMETSNISNVQQEYKLNRESISTNSNMISLCYVSTTTLVPPNAAPPHHMAWVQQRPPRLHHAPLRPRRGVQSPIAIYSIRFTLCRIHNDKKNPAATLIGEHMKFPNHYTDILN